MIKRFSAVVAAAALLSSPAVATYMQTSTLSLDELGDGKNTVYYFKSGGVLYGDLEGSDFTGFSMRIITDKVVPLEPIGEPRTSDRPPPGAADESCTEWYERCFVMRAMQFNVCYARCTQRKDPATGESRPTSTEKNIYLTIASDVTKLN